MRKAAYIISVIALLATVVEVQAVTIEQVRQTIERVRGELAPDRRQTVYDVTAEALPDGHIYITGKLSDPAIHDILMAEVNALGDVADHTVLLPQDQWAIVRVPVACMRTAGKYSAELATQALMGMPIRLLEKENGWWRVQTPDGYLGWMYGSSFTPKTVEQMQAWRGADRLVVTTHHQIAAYDSPKATSPRSIVTDLLPGNIVERKSAKVQNGRIEVALPDGRACWADAKAFTPIKDWASQTFNADVILDQAYAMMGAPYLWGGTSAKTTDCSGLVKISYLANGLILRRDASQQALIGQHIAPDDIDTLEPGDLLFFGDTPGGRVTHVAIYDHDKYFIHCAGRVHQSRMVSDDSTFGHREYMGATRIKGHEGTEGIVRAIDHPWYF